MICVILLILPFINFPHSAQGAIIDIWGTSQGTTITYTFTRTYSGSLSVIDDLGEYKFSVTQIWDNDGNNYTELFLIRQKLVSGASDLTTRVLEDSDIFWDHNDFIGAVSLLTEEISPLVPITFNDLENIGLNWTAQIQYINASLTNYTVTVDGNIVIFYHWESGVDVGTGAYYTEHEYTTWDRSTGWLISYDDFINYEEPANFAKRTLVERKTSTGLTVDLYLIIGLIGIISGIGGIIISFLVFKKRDQFTK